MGYTLVTGATSDIGKQICITLAAEGHLILLSDISEATLKETLLSLNGNGHKILPLDLSDVECCSNTLATFIKNEGINISHAVFAAGIFTVKPLKLINYDFIRRNFDIAVFSVIMLTQVLASKKFNGDSLKGIVMVSSVSAIMGTKGYITYSAVKSAMLGIVKSFAAELSPKVRVNAILPGGVRTRTTNFLYESQEAANPRYLLGDGQPSDISNVISFLVSDKSRWITGQEIVVDGGFVIS